MIFFGIPSVNQLKPSLLFGGDDHYGFIQTIIGEIYERKEIAKRCQAYYEKDSLKYWDQIITFMNFLAFKKLDEKNQFEPIPLLSFVAEEYDKENELPSKILFDYFLSQWQFPHPINTTKRNTSYENVLIDDLRKLKITKPYGAILQILLHLNDKGKSESYLSEGEFYWIDMEFYKSEGAIFQPDNIKDFSEKLFNKRKTLSDRQFEELPNEHKGKPYLSYPKGFLRNSCLLTDDKDIYPNADKLFIGLNYFAINNTEIVIKVIQETFRTSFKIDPLKKPTDKQLSFDFSNYLYSENGINLWLENTKLYPAHKSIFDKVKGFTREFDSHEYARIKVNTQLNRLSVLDKLTITRRRTEQNLLRNFLFKNKKDGQCSLCHKHYPIRFLATAHIKRRTDCSDDEKKNINVVMPACRFGCDDLYEEGYLVVRDGAVKSNIKERSSTHELVSYIKNIENNNCLSWKDESKGFFEFHEKQNT
jgi:hypothetical protein